MNKLLVVIGEASGDLHGGNVLRRLKSLQPELKIIGTGGDIFSSIADEVYYRVEDLAVIGFFEVLKKYSYYKNIFKSMVKKLETEKPDAVFLVDYAGFNLRFAAEAKKRGIKVIFYIAPQVWAWKKNRIKKIKKFVDELIVIFPFEVDFFKDYDMTTHCFGHPLLDIVKPSLSKEDLCSKYKIDQNKQIVCFLPGSRKNEILKHLPLLLESAEILAEKDANLQFIVPLAPTVSKSDIEIYQNKLSYDVKFIPRETYNLVAAADFAVVASGTATLETAILETPLAVFYRVSPITFFIGKHILKIGLVGLPNIISGEEVVPELIQKKSSAEQISSTVLYYLKDKNKHQKIKQRISTVKNSLGKTGAYQKTAEFLNGIL
jgi:lipid-A-disaccharide synthase